MLKRVYLPLNLHFPRFFPIFFMIIWTCSLPEMWFLHGPRQFNNPNVMVPPRFWVPVNLSPLYLSRKPPGENDTVKKLNLAIFKKNKMQQLGFFLSQQFSRIPREYGGGLKTVLKCIKIAGFYRINFPGFPVKKGVKFVKMSRIPREKGVILNFWNGRVLHLQIQTGHTGA